MKVLFSASLAVLCVCGSAATQTVRTIARRLVISDEHGSLTAYLIAPDVLRIDYEPNTVDRSPGPTIMLDPKGLRNHKPMGRVNGSSISTPAMRVVGSSKGLSITGVGQTSPLLVRIKDLESGTFSISGIRGENLYGIHGIPNRRSLTAAEASLLRNDGGHVSADAQGNGGAPLVYSTHFGLLVDSIDGDFSVANDAVAFQHGSRPDFEAYVVIGQPERTMAVATGLTGHPPMPPKWSLGFLNSQWGSNEQQIKDLVAEYRRKQIPLDAFILDFDFKAWGEDNYGEFRWNSTSGPGNVNPDAFPDGQSGLFAKQLLAKGVHLVGIMKPRILIQNAKGEMNVGAKEATEHNWWLPGRKPYADYFSHRQANDLDFSKPDLRAWYWLHAKGLFDSGIDGWWNDEADGGFPSTGFMQMQQSLYEGQSSVSKKRVWSINRNFYLGAQRYAFGTWSGDIRTGFASMQAQRARMLTLLDLDQPHWSMDGGGFNGHPSPENYARWIEFAAMVPIMRVHGTYGEKRQPWVYGPEAEAAAKAAIELRYRLKPYLYSCERDAYETGVGIARPMFWEFPNDPDVADTAEEWMLGSSLLVSPVVEQGQSEKSVTLPKGNWFDYFSDQPYSGGKLIQVRTSDWSSIPMFVRGGSIVATEPVEQYAGEKPTTQLRLDVWPDASRIAKFRIYDDNGKTVAYKHGAYFSQDVRAVMANGKVVVSFARPHGSTPYKTYDVVVHHVVNQGARWNGSLLWSVLQGEVTPYSVPAGVVGNLVLK